MKDGPKRLPGDMDKWQNTQTSRTRDTAVNGAMGNLAAIYNDLSLLGEVYKSISQSTSKHAPGTQLPFTVQYPMHGSKVLFILDTEFLLLKE